MSNMTDNSARANDKYLLDDEERWENLGFDWESWNATVKKILRKQTIAVSNDSGRKPRVARSSRSFSSSNWMS